MRSFGSDNHSGVNTEIVEAIQRANIDHVVAYGEDNYTCSAKQKIKEIFGINDIEVFFVFNGTGANILALRSILKPYNSIIAASSAHIVTDECGAPEFMTGASIKSINTDNGKLNSNLISRFLYDIGNEHHSQVKAVYISQCTEFGTVYTCEEIRNIANFAHNNNMYLHVDGARIANAAVFLKKSMKEMITNTGVDVLSFGGTKNGMMCGEAVICFRKELFEDMKFIRKQSAQLYSKMRFVSSQFLAYFENDLWLQNAEHANKMSQLLRKGLSNFPFFYFTQSTEANILLVKTEKFIIEKMLENNFFYIWNKNENEIRLVTSWDTTEEDIYNFINSVSEAVKIYQSKNRY